MVKSADEIPITYLNKGQAYAVSISDNVGLGPTVGLVKYRTVIRVSFEDEEQRRRPSQSWQLWKEGRGLAEAHQRGGRLQAVEYVDPSQGGDIETRKSRVELEKASFDGFSMVWSPTPGASVASNSVSVRFNFLSTDFSHSKGVKGIPVRLCAKTEIISSGTPDSPPESTAEVCYCKVKLFRDHGAERKLSNDVAHIKKMIDKLKQQIEQAESGAKDLGKRKRSGSRSMAAGRAGKIPKHKRTWSASSQGSAERLSVDDDVQSKLTGLQDMFSSTRPVSVLYLRGSHDDDPDAFPVALPKEPSGATKINPISRRQSQDQGLSSESTPTDLILSRTSSSMSAPVRPQPHMDPIIHPSRKSETNVSQLSSPRTESGYTMDSHATTISHSGIKIPKMSHDRTTTYWINAFEIDPTYRTPPARPSRLVACFYVLIKISGGAPDNDCYRAVYLMQRTVSNLISSITHKCGVQPESVSRTIRINSKGLKIAVDDEMVQEMSEGQDMVVDFNELDLVKSESGSASSTPKATSILQHTQTKLEMRLIF